VVRRLRDFFKTGHTRRDPVPILPLVVETIGEVEERAKRQACRLEYAIPADLPPARGDGVQLQVVLRNLLINALDAVSPESFGRSTDEPVVSLAAHRDGNELQLVVQDNGPGILPQFRERLFEPFATSKPTGMGLGLAISRAIVEAHGGRLWAESPSAGGSRFTIALPLHHSVYSVKPLPVKGAP
jgi:signal transduction histidine kinase